MVKKRCFIALVYFYHWCRAGLPCCWLALVFNKLMSRGFTWCSEGSLCTFPLAYSYCHCTKTKQPKREMAGIICMALAVLLAYDYIYFFYSLLFFYLDGMWLDVWLSLFFESSGYMLHNCSFSWFDATVMCMIVAPLLWKCQCVPYTHTNVIRPNKVMIWSINHLHVILSFPMIAQLCLGVNYEYMLFSKCFNACNEPANHCFILCAFPTVTYALGWQGLVWWWWWWWCCLSALKWGAVMMVTMVVCTVCIPRWECIWNRAVFVVVAPYRGWCVPCCGSFLTVEGLNPWLCTWIPRWLCIGWRSWSLILK